MSRDGWTTQKFAAISWWIGLAAASGLVLVGGFRLGNTGLPPHTPFDATGSGHAEQWLFLDEASRVVPDDTSLTVAASDADTEMSLYMMAVGLVPHATIIPKSYYGRPVAATDTARFVAAFGAAAGAAESSSRTIEIAGGTVTDRGTSRP